MPKPYSLEGCEYCDTLTLNKQYRGKLYEHRTNSGKTIPWTDVSSGIRLTRTVDYTAESGEVFRGNEISHNPRTHDAVSKSTNLIAFTVTSTRMKRYVLTQVKDARAILESKLRSNKDMSPDAIADHISDSDSSIEVVEDMLNSLNVNLPPQRVEQVVYRIVRNPKIARLIKERQSYVCEICNRRPFIQKNGKPYAEADHIKPLGGTDKGLDTPENLRCLCAQCHAVITHGSDEEINRLLGINKQ